MSYEALFLLVCQGSYNLSELFPQKDFPHLSLGTFRHVILEDQVFAIIRACITCNYGQYCHS